MNNVDQIIKRMEELINSDDSFGAYEEYTQMIDETYKEGYKDGICDTQQKIVKKLLDEKFDINLIHKITGLSKTDIKNML